MEHVNRKKIVSEQDKLLFDTIAEKYAKKDYVPSSALARRYKIQFALLPFLDENHSLGTVLDIGCGVGAPADFLLPNYEKYIGIDYSEKLIEAARTFHKNNEQVKFIVADIQKNLDRNTQFQENSVDCVLSIGALHHITNLNAVFDNLKRLAKKNALFIAIEPNRSNPLIQFLRYIRGKIDSSYSGDQHFYSRLELEHLMKENGFRDYKIRGEAYFSTPFAEIIMPWQTVSVNLSRIAVSIDRFLDNNLPSFFHYLCWNLVVRARF